MGQKIAYINVRYDICRDASLGLPCDFALLLVLTRPPLPTLRLKPFRFYYLTWSLLFGPLAVLRIENMQYARFGIWGWVCPQEGGGGRKEEREKKYGQV